MTKLHYLLVAALGGSAAYALVTTPAASSIAPTTSSTTHDERPIDLEEHDDEALPPGHPAIAASGTSKLPPGHPPIGGGGAMEAAGPIGDAPEALVTWKASASWRAVPNPNAMRIATYRAGEAELAVSSAGGGADGNVERWIGQFATAGRAVRLEQRVVGDLHVRVVHVQGTLADGARSGFAMLGAVVETGETLTFFKMTGPATAVEKERAAFDALIKSLARR
jgi:hypothetical protein